MNFLGPLPCWIKQRRRQTILTYPLVRVFLVLLETVNTTVMNTTTTITTTTNQKLPLHLPLHRLHTVMRVNEIPFVRVSSYRSPNQEMSTKQTLNRPNFSPKKIWLVCCIEKRTNGPLSKRGFYPRSKYWCDVM